MILSLEEKARFRCGKHLCKALYKTVAFLLLSLDEKVRMRCVEHLRKRNIGVPYAFSRRDSTNEMCGTSKEGTAAFLMLSLDEIARMRCVEHLRKEQWRSFCFL